MGGIDSAKKRRLIEDFGILFEGGGLPRMSGRVFGWLLISSPQHQTAGEIAAGVGASKGSMSFTCSAPIDIGPDMTVWPCFPLSAVRRRSAYEFDSYAQMREYYDGFMREIRQEAGGIHEKCDACSWRKKGLCAGGCAAHVLREIDKEGAQRDFKI